MLFPFSRCEDDLKGWKVVGGQGGEGGRRNSEGEFLGGHIRSLIRRTHQQRSEPHETRVCTRSRAPPPWKHSAVRDGARPPSLGGRGRAGQGEGVEGLSRHEERQARKLEGQGCTQRGLDTRQVHPQAVQIHPRASSGAVACLEILGKSRRPQRGD